MSGNTGHSGPFKRLVVLGESTVEGGGWLASPQESALETAGSGTGAIHVLL